MNHLVIFPILIPLLGAIVSLFVEHRRFSTLTRRWVSAIALGCLLASIISLYFVVQANTLLFYLLGDWPARLGIALLADRLSVFMLIIMVLLAIPCLLHACSGWDKRAPHFHALFQFQLMGLSGAFLTNDIFNLFVFFEVLLLASYGLLLSAGRGQRIRSGLHYVIFNVAASTLFLIALAFIYGLLGSLNMLEISQRIATAPSEDIPLIKAAFGILFIVFCAKAALLPLYLWLPDTYARAPAAVAALFTILTKVGLYAVLRVNSLVLATTALEHWAQPALLTLGVITLLLSAIGVLGAQRLRIMVAYLVLSSSATLFIAFSIGSINSITAGLFYLLHSTFAAAALFLISDLILRQHGKTRDKKGVVSEKSGKTLSSIFYLIGAISIIGLPPLSGFLAKVSVLKSIPADKQALVWTVILVSSLLTLLGMVRGGIRLFWWVPERPSNVPVMTFSVRRSETRAVVLLLGYGILITIMANPILSYTQSVALQLSQPKQYLYLLQNTPSLLREP